MIVVHAAVVARGDRAAILPAPPGSGKSTLAAALAFRGWRLLSDEFAVVDTATGDLIPVPRPLALKGPSIQLMRGRVPDIRFGPLLQDVDRPPTRYAAPPATAVRESQNRARPGWIVVPQWREGASTALTPVTKARALSHLADSSFNYNLVGPAGFARLADLVDHSPCYSLSYGDLDGALTAFDRLSTEGQGLPMESAS